MTSSIDTVFSMLSFSLKAMIEVKLLKFAKIGVLNTIFGYSVFSLLIFLGLHYQCAVILGTILSVMFNFNTIGRYVFNRCDTRLILKFALVYSIIATLNICLIHIGVTHHINVYLMGAILLLPLGSLSFILNKTIVFGEKLFGIY
ncbi:MAG: GtrA family protein [Candidatus Gastranaerophilales bacterium]|nr:GtrA family protein [Candidatus Gastranaerophilales bacterium]